MMKYRNKDGTYYEENSRQDQLLDWMYHHAIGRAMLKILVNPAISRTMGRLLNTKLSCVFIEPFIRANHIAMGDYRKKKYCSYNDFFTRQIRSDKRPIIKQKDILISPCDGKVTAYPIDEKLTFQVKHTWYNIKTLLRNSELAAFYREGTCVILRLTVDDYHHYCYVDDGHKGRNHRIKGVLHTVNPVANEVVPVFKENAREYTTMVTENFGVITQIEVGALMVGKITNHHQEAVFHKGEEKGYFEFGGSTIILLLEKDKAEVLPILLENTEKGYETIVKMGEIIGKAV